MNYDEESTAVEVDGMGLKYLIADLRCVVCKVPGSARFISAGDSLCEEHMLRRPMG